MVPKETGAPAARQPLQCPICGTFVEMDLINPNGTDLSPKD
jgi:hypothetical protein